MIKIFGSGIDNIKTVVLLCPSQTSALYRYTIG